MKSCRWDAGQALEFTGCSHQTSECEGNVISVTEWVGFLWRTVSIVCTKWCEKQKTSNEKQFYRQKWLMRGQRRMTNWFELTGRLFKVTYLYNHLYKHSRSEQKSISYAKPWGTAEEHAPFTKEQESEVTVSTGSPKLDKMAAWPDESQHKCNMNPWTEPGVRSEGWWGWCNVVGNFLCTHWATLWNLCHEELRLSWES